MITERARVVIVAEGSVWVEPDRQASCVTRCANQGCGTASLVKALGRRRFRMQAINHLPLNVGDEVIVGVDAHALLQGLFIVYLVPLLMLLAGAGFGAFLYPDSEGTSILVGVIGLTAGILWSRSFSCRIRSDGRYQSRVLERVAVRVSSDCALSP